MHRRGTDDVESLTIDRQMIMVGVQIVERTLLAALRHRQFFSLAELNAAIAELLIRRNLRPFKQLPGSRQSQFEAIDRPALKPLPSTPYEYAAWKQARVHIDYHIEVERHYYSVPQHLVKRQLDVRVTASTIECFHQGQRVACHRRVKQPGRHTTITAHMPEQHRHLAQFSPERLQRWAAKIGPETAALITPVLAERPHPEQGYRACLGILRLAKSYGDKRLNAACARALILATHRYKSGEELGGCDFTGENQQSFLSATDSRDVQAAPGNGKTTLLVAKLALLSRSWASRTQGVCVISHTNAAREEVEKKLFNHPSASAFLEYPHFIGTVTSFIDRFIALPCLRGLGWSVQRIDDEVFAAVALSRWGSKPALLTYSRINRGRNISALEQYVTNLALADDFECLQNVSPQRLKVFQRPRQPGPQSATGAALEELKAEIVRDGYYRFADMNALAHQAIEKCPGLLESVRKRFPLVLLDEAQDTNGVQLALLNRVFSEGIAYQRLGDENQTLL